MNVRKLFQSVVLILCGLAGMMLFVPACGAQESGTPLEAGVDYNYVRANGPPGGCSCFSMNGGNAWVAYEFSHGVSAVAEFSGQHAGNINATGEDLTLFSYLFGPRYTVRMSDRWLPFGQVLLGGAHASGTFEPSGSGGSGSYNSFSMVAGGGLDIKVAEHIGIRATEVDYYLTRFPNGVNGRENNLRISAGLVFRF
ncbi:MAG: outer membrane beta-barrel protein [Candidatus Acidiferrales bacterium]